MKGVDGLKKFKRTPIDFPVGENVKCYLSAATVIGGTAKNGKSWRAFKLNHATKVPNLRDDAKTEERVSVFRDMYWIPVSGKLSDEGDEKLLKTFEWNISYYIQVVYGVKIPLHADSLDYESWLKEILSILRESPRTYYYLKVKLEPRNGRLYLTRGNVQYVSKQPSLKYTHNEYKNHTYIVNIKPKKSK